MTETDLSNMDSERYGCLEKAGRIWAIGSIHADVTAVKGLHSQLLEKFQEDDKLVYLGNYFGSDEQNIETLDEMLYTRLELMAQMKDFQMGDIVYLRGAREEMFSKLLQLQFAPNPSEVMDWLLEHGLGPTIEAYGTRAHVARAISREGTLAITRWTNGLRREIHSHSGHMDLMKHLRRAAFTRDGRLLFVHASVDTSRPLNMQKDHFWWDNGRFEQIEAPFSGFSRVIRGYDHAGGGVVLDRKYTATIDGGCGRGGGLHAVCFAPDGEILDHIES